VRADAEKILSSHKKDQHKQTNKKNKDKEGLFLTWKTQIKNHCRKKIFKRNPTKLICPEKRERMSKCR
jgi:AMMECR1 domain-containing protein